MHSGASDQTLPRAPSCSLRPNRARRNRADHKTEPRRLIEANADTVSAQANLKKGMPKFNLYAFSELMSL
jgi:hypothetical protein